MQNLTDFAGGQINAHAVLLRALIATHPNREQLRAAFESRAQAALAAAVPTPVREAYVQGLQQELETLWAGL